MRCIPSLHCAWRDWRQAIIVIGRLSGTIMQKKTPSLIVDVNGVGYEVEAPMSTIYALPGEGDKVNLFIHTHVREDAIQLFGFASEIERRFFRTLIKISGVGAKMALAILSGISAQGFAAYVQQEDAKALTQLPGIGRKTAERLIIEMRDKLEKEVFMGALPDAHHPPRDPVAMPHVASAAAEAITALVALGYKPPEANKMIKGMPKQIDSAEELIRLALK